MTPPTPPDSEPPWWKWLLLLVASMAAGALVAFLVLSARAACAAPDMAVTDGSRAVILAHVTAEQGTGHACR